ncbi:MAG: DUF3298/DUF4163 domain-containing protein [Chitinophagaceae bacterium]|nr:MAG: DUF3298/DUF4163 domain-containing protein [Chitinophagaceae bacterium]
MLQSCEKELEFQTKTFEEKTSLPCKADACPEVKLEIPIAGNKGFISDSINNKVFSTVKEIIYFGEKPYDAKDYSTLLKDFIGSYEMIRKDDPTDASKWVGKASGKVVYQSEKIINIEIEHYTFTGGAHGYSGKRSLIFDGETGKIIPNAGLFKDITGFTKLAEAKFRKKYNLAPNAPINSDGFMFETGSFTLPETIFYMHDGILLVYNVYEIASYAEGPQEIMIPIAEARPFLATE